MIPQWDFWLISVALLILVTYLVSKCVVHLRINFSKKWVWSITLIALYLGCMMASLGFNFLSSQQIALAKDMKKPTKHSQIGSGWGANFSKEKRTQYSLSMARSLFIKNGKFVDFIDLNGKLSEYEPTAVDRQKRSELLLFTERIEISGNQMFFVGIGWLLIPLLGVGIGFTDWIVSRLFPNVSFERG